MVVLLDNGHGEETKGKSSPMLPDGRQLREYNFAREIAAAVKERLDYLGITTILVTPEDWDVKLKERCKRINEYCNKFGIKNCLSISIHCNASHSDNKWHDARGFCVFVSPNASDNSKLLAQSIYKMAERQKLQGNRWIPKEKYWVKNLAMCRDTKCPAVLTENLFMDNKEDCKLLLSEEGKSRIVEMHVHGILDYIKKVSK